MTLSEKLVTANFFNSLKHHKIKNRFKLTLLKINLHRFSY